MSSTGERGFGPLVNDSLTVMILNGSLPQNGGAKMSCQCIFNGKYAGVHLSQSMHADIEVAVLNSYSV